MLVQLLSFYLQAIKQRQGDQTIMADIGHTKWDFPKHTGTSIDLLLPSNSRSTLRAILTASCYSMMFIVYSKVIVRMMPARNMKSFSANCNSLVNTCLSRVSRIH